MRGREKNIGGVDEWMNVMARPNHPFIQSSSVYKIFRRIVFFCFLFVNATSYSQKLIMEEIPEKIFEPPVYGLKGKHYVHIFYEGSFLSGHNGSDSLKTNGGKSFGWNFGFRYKLKL